MNGNAEAGRSLRSRRWWVVLLLVALLGGSAACIQSDGKPTPFSGPSTLALALTITASPDVLRLDGGLPSVIVIVARDSNGDPVRDLRLTVQIIAGGEFQDFGRLSDRSPKTDSDGRAVVVYTVPLTSANPAGQTDEGIVVGISVTPEDKERPDFNGTLPRVVSIRLVPPGTVIPAFAVFPSFSVSTSTPVVFDQTLFTADPCGAVPEGAACAPNLITSYDWDFGDGNTGTGQSVTHAYALAGTFVATLTVGDSFNRSVSVAQTLDVGTGTPPTAAASISPTSPNVDDTIFFSASASTPGPGRTIVGYSWDFGDGSTGTGENVSHAYSVADIYTAVLTVTDDKGQKGIATLTVTVSTSAPTAVFTTSPAAPVVNETINFNGTASTATSGRTLVNFKWDFGDGTDSSLGSRVTHAYSTPESFVARLTVTDSFGETGTTTQTVAVVASALPTVSFTASPSPAGTGVAVTFDASASTAGAGATITNYAWSFGDTTAGVPNTASTTSAIVVKSAGYAVAASYTITLTITDSNGDTATGSIELTVS